jgi:hypothetical protein
MPGAQSTFSFPSLADISNLLTGLSAPERLPTPSDIQNIALDTGVPTPILQSLINVESAGNAFAIGSSGEIGLTQLTPSTAAALGVDPYDPFQNVLGGASYLAQLFSKYGDWADALAAYNAGSPSSPAGQAYAQKVITGAYPVNTTNSLPANLFPTTTAAGATGTALGGASPVPGSTTTPASGGTPTASPTGTAGGFWFNAAVAVAILGLVAFGAYTLIKG